MYFIEKLNLFSSPFCGSGLHRHRIPPNQAEWAVMCPRWHLKKGLRLDLIFHENTFSQISYAIISCLFPLVIFFSINTCSQMLCDENIIFKTRL